MASNYEFKGPKVSIKEHWEDGMYLLFDTETQKPLLVGSRESILEEYDRRNNITDVSE